MLIKNAATTPMPSSFDKNEIGLMTASEFLGFKNKDNKHHPSNSYDLSLKKLNHEPVYKSKSYYLSGKGHEFRIYGSDVKDKSLVIDSNNATIGVIIRGVLYYNPVSKIRPTDFQELGVGQFKKVKYPAEYVDFVKNQDLKNRADYPVLLQNVKVKGEQYQLRAASKPEKDVKVNLALINQIGQIVAVAQNEWGATLIVTAKEYRGLGLGRLIGSYWYKLNPSSTSGGFTQSGERNALKLWEMRVREFSENGWYSSLVKSGDLSLDRLKQILSGTSGLKINLNLGEMPTEAQEKKLLLWSDGISFILYDSKFLDDWQEPNEDLIHAFGFVREDKHGAFYYSFDYDPDFKLIATKIALQIIRKHYDNRLYLDVKTGADFLGDFEEFGDSVSIEGDFLVTKKDFISLGPRTAEERRKRKPIDPYGEVLTTLLETAEGKWKW